MSSDLAKLTAHSLAYYSHSYRAEDKHINLFFWELFNDAGFYFTVDRKPDKPTPMHVSYLEWLMRRSACFVAVIPKREDQESYYPCSRYQVFESELASLAQKPRLLFVEDGLPNSLFNGSANEICFFNPRWYKDDRSRFETQAEILIKKVAASTVIGAQPGKPVGLVCDFNREPYSPQTIKAMEQVIRKNRLISGGVINPYQRFQTSASFASLLEQFEVIISEIRSPYVPVDVLARAQEKCIPMIKVCYLKEGEKEENVIKAMHLSHKHRDEPWELIESEKWPWIFSGYQLDNEMQPIIFWRHLDDLLPSIESQLNKIGRSLEYQSEVLSTFPEAKKYFLSHGRINSQIFISNASAQNSLAEEIKSGLLDQGVNYFHYTDIEAIPIGTPDWEAAVRRKISESNVFLALLSEAYLDSKYCKMEMDDANQLHKNRTLTIHPYLVENMKWPQQILGRIQGKDLTKEDQAVWAQIIVERIVKHLETPGEHDNRPFPVDNNFGPIDILYAHGQGRLSILNAIQSNQADTNQEAECNINKQLYEPSRVSTLNASDWAAFVSAIGTEIYNKISGCLPEISERYKITLEQRNYNKKQVHIRLVNDEEGINIPFEWMVRPGNARPLCLEHPFYRFLTGCEAPRPQLSTLKPSEIRVLLVASNTGGVPCVDDEVDELEKLILREWKLAKEGVRKLNTLNATPDEIKRQIKNGNYHMLHFAGHGSFDHQKGFYFQVKKSTIGNVTAKIYSNDLKDWISNSDLRFVYLSSCLSSADAPSNNNTFKFVTGLLQAVAESGVADIIGFNSLISDAESKKMCLSFYENFVKTSDPAISLFEARKRMADNVAKIWAAPILLRQIR